MAVRITKYAAEEISREALNQAFKKQDEELTAEENELLSRVWHHLFKKHKKDILSVPKGWIKEVNNLTVNAGGWKITLRGSDENWRVPLVTSEYNHAFAILDEKLISEVQEFSKKKEDIKTKKERTRSTLNAMLLNAYSFNNLLKIWPEGQHLFIDKLGAIEPTKAIAIAFHDINSVLGFPPPESEIFIEAAKEQSSDVAT